VSQIWSRVRETLDRRPEAQKAKQAAKARSSAQSSAGGLITVQKGDTYYSLSQRHGVPLRALLEANKARPPYVLSPGDRVRLPTQAFYEVKKKDTLYSISRSHNTDVATLAKLNGLRKPFTISVGQRLQIPGLKASPVQAVAKALTPAPAKPKTMPTAPKRVGRFLVPVKGAIISSFGPKDGGLHNDGINIAAREGAPIRAAENGVVVYTGNELRGYGNLLLIRHSGGWVTAYAHTSKFLVKPGARVKQGDVVAEVGRTGNVDRPQLHFELRKGTRAVNPQSLI
jgi:murein DD-endopeptidase MepM/ murein hydrolase activator NlpD